ncbi:MAG: hypothetical protein ALAOOOJD_04280 [bacterium]|nr:hypothetical protein [bacterium]
MDIENRFAKGRRGGSKLRGERINGGAIAGLRKNHRGTHLRPFGLKLLIHPCCIILHAEIPFILITHGAADEIDANEQHAIPQKSKILLAPALMLGQRGAAKILLKIQKILFPVDQPLGGIVTVGIIVVTDDNVSRNRKTLHDTGHFRILVFRTRPGAHNVPDMQNESRRTVPVVIEHILLKNRYIVCSAFGNIAKCGKRDGLALRPNGRAQSRNGLQQNRDDARRKPSLQIVHKTSSSL